MLRKIFGLVTTLIQHTFNILDLEMVDDILRFFFCDLVCEDLRRRIVTLHLEPGGIRKNSTDGCLQEDVVDAVFVLLCLDRLTDALKVHNLLELLFEYRSGGEVEKDNEE